MKRILFAILIIIFFVSCGKKVEEKVKETPHEIIKQEVNNVCEDTIKYYSDRFLKPLKPGEKVEDWWPLSKGIKYKYKIVSSRWDFGEKYINKEFELTFVKVNDSEYSIKIRGFDEFPYKSLKIDGQRIYLDNEGMPLIAFPLFEDMFYGSESYQKEFMVEAEKYRKQNLIYAPIRNDLWKVIKVAGDIYSVQHIEPRGLYFEFKKGFGMTRWIVSGGYELEMFE